jgi:hypothetical protein
MTFRAWIAAGFGIAIAAAACDVAAAKWAELAADATFALIVAGVWWAGSGSRQ